MNPFGKVIDIFVAVLICFLFPILYFAQKQDILTQMLVYDIVKDFVDATRVQGEITQEMYDSFTYRLSSTGNAYEVTLVNRQTAYEPEYQLAAGTPVFTGKVMEYKSEIYMKELVDAIYTTGRYVFEKGDYLSVQVINRTDTFAGTLLRIPYVGFPAEQIVVTYGGTIRDSG